MKTLFFMDYESQDLRHVFSQPCQFGYVRTDLNLAPTGEHGLKYILPRRDVIPAPGAVLTHRILPGDCVRDDAVCEFDFARWMNQTTSTPGTITLGYNSLSFDENLTRFMLWRNLQDVYGREYGACGRADLISVVRAFGALRPDGINWPVKEDGMRSYRLGDMCEANGISLANAHDAYADTLATVELARLLRARNADLFDHFLTMAGTETVAAVVGADFRNRRIVTPKPFIFVDTSVGIDRAYTTIAFPLCIDPSPTQSKSVICVDLLGDMDALQAATPDELYVRCFKFIEDIEERRERVRLPLLRVRCNRAPFVAPISALRAEDATRLGISIEAAKAALARVQADFSLSGRAGQASMIYAPSRGPVADAQLYDGFLDRDDRRLLDSILGQPPARWMATAQGLRDVRCRELVFLAKARNFEGDLTPEERVRWHAFRRAKLLDGDGSCGVSLPVFQREMAEVRAGGNLTPDDEALLVRLERYVASLVADL